MKLRLTVVPALVVTACLLLQAGVGAQDKDKDVVVNDQLVAADVKDKVRTQCYCKTYTFKMTEGKSYQIDMQSAVLDSYLRLEDPDGRPLAEDDDSGGNLNARILFRAPKTGDYQIVATSFSASTGKFTLTIKDTTK